MQTQTLVLIAAFAICGGSSLVESSLIGNLISTSKIVDGLCKNDANRKNQAVIDAFFACYDQAPGKQLFVNCQTKLFGGPMNTIPSVDASCNQPCKLPVYATCIATSFRRAGLDMNDAVEKLNACQAKVLGV